MGATSSIVGWVGIGLAAALIAMALPNRRGVAGAAINLVLGVIGGLAGGLLGRAVGLYSRVDHPESFLLAMIGALATLIGYHIVFARHHRQIA